MKQKYQEQSDQRSSLVFKARKCQVLATLFTQLVKRLAMLKGKFNKTSNATFHLTAYVFMTIAYVTLIAYEPPSTCNFESTIWAQINKETT